jgi:hypothetical protein
LVNVVPSEQDWPAQKDFKTSTAVQSNIAAILKVSNPAEARVGEKDGHST